MTQKSIKQLEIELWEAADELRANSKLTAAEYKDPLLGLILLRFAENKYEEAKDHLAETLPINPRTKQRREATKDDFAQAGAMQLPEKAQYSYLASLPESEDLAETINTAMKLIEAEYEDLAGILPKNYQELTPEDDSDNNLLANLIRIFNSDSVRNAKGDVFGRVYEYFLMKLSMMGAGAQEGGEFFTPPSLVQLIVNFIQPDHGIIHDPACGSGGMFVQTAHFIKNIQNKSVNQAVTVYGTEYKSNNTRLAKMNLAIHGIEGKIANNNSFYSDPHELFGKCDFLMANPPFNVDKVDAKNKFLAEDKRLPFGAPLTGKGTIGNANYLWIQYFMSYLNPTGRAGFVMASSATDAGNAEKRIREELIKTGNVDCIVSVSNNFFYTRSLPCHLWFFDKGASAPLSNRKDKILMIDARNVYRKVSTTINDFSEQQLEGLTAIMALYRGEKPKVAKDNAWFNEHFPDGIYRDVEGLCKVVDLEEVAEQDYSLTPGRYVGVKIDIDMDFDYKTRMQELHSELAELNTEANQLMNQIQAFKL
ncbi:type I restriction enzyme M protein [Chryseobacterium ginsenosidimutans]|uniref:type I restriction-modification system subunit M n=1 Tax=Chryseobacterium ginsenosidimutans TaxID=687846 RepID=UPI00277DFB64|nr:type I restriction-modification system subunit M [Chryseobacterium ginsenosidimutans]MDQ0593936.1 type I restriction enzyme M protein [Chryseobacterium ginsenosidimutans]